MKLKLLICTLFFLISTVTFAQNDTDSFDKDLSSIVEGERMRAGFHLNARASDVTNNYDITHQRCEWEIDPAVFFISGVITTTFEPTEANISNIEFDLKNNMVIDSIVYNGSTVSYSQSANHLLSITFPTTLNINQSYEIEVAYHGVPITEGFGSFNQTTHGPALDTILWTLSEPYGAKNWWPCKQDLNDKIDSIDIIVTVPTGNKVASNGLLINTTTSGNDVTYHWAHKHPITPYLVAISVTNYVEYTDIATINGENIPILNYVYPESLTYAQTNTPNVIPVMQLFSDLFGEYPFADEKYGHAQFPWGGGMEHQTMSFMVNFSFNLMAHELAHQWFGDNITCGSWEDLWLNESFATYLTGLSRREVNGEADFLSWKSSVINHATSQPGGSVWVSDTTDLYRLFSGRLTYNKGSVVLNMMRNKVGDTAFFQALVNYRNNHEDGFASTDNLKFEMENTSGIDLTEFLDDWFYGEGYPIYNIGVSTISGTTQSSIQINQTTSHVSVPFFEMSVPIRFTFQNGTDSIYFFDNTVSGEEFYLELPHVVTAVTYDPNLEIMSKNSSITLTTLASNVDHDLDGVTSDNGDCNDFDININPTAVEICDDVDNNCNGQTDEITTNVFTGNINNQWGVPGNWSLMKVPDYCHNVTILGAFNITIAPNEIAKANAINISSNSSLNLGANSDLSIQDYQPFNSNINGDIDFSN